MKPPAENTYDAMQEVKELKKIPLNKKFVKDYDNIEGAFKKTAKDILITSQLRTSMILNEKIKSSNYTLETINKNIYIFGIALDTDEKKEIINEANKIYGVEEVIPTIYLVSELSRNRN